MRYILTERKLLLQYIYIFFFAVTDRLILDVDEGHQLRCFYARTKSSCMIGLCESVRDSEKFAPLSRTSLVRPFPYHMVMSKNFVTIKPVCSGRIYLVTK